MQGSHSPGNYPFKNKASFQEITTRRKPSFIEQTTITTEQGQQRTPTVEEQMVMLMTGMQQLLQQGNRRTTNFTRSKLPEPDTYHGDRSSGAIESWTRTMERYLELNSLEEHEWVPYAVMKLRDEAEEWWQQRSFLGPEVSEWADIFSLFFEQKLSVYSIFWPLDYQHRSRSLLP